MARTKEEAKETPEVEEPVVDETPAEEPVEEPAEDETPVEDEPETPEVEEPADEPVDPEPTPAPAPKKAKLTNFYVEGYGNVLGKDFEDACANAEKIKAKIREP